ncbi:MAG: glutamine--fructose-6-phosphate transaminase (isomerizing) [Candidatus Eremiobacteraeota bacterium]|nr:glutamine--fructose-6-phosphate transaminase (isomerizing) [Candidatus Eremiobacteraeota bacterium]
MCGIIGYIGKKETVPILIEGLSKLEYRGYDSAGVVVVREGSLHEIKSVGKLEKLEKKLQGATPSGSPGIGHTRWATHGKPSDINAHPHLDCSRTIALVHNGIIENYLELKESLAREGHRFLSDTDTEVLVHLIEKYYGSSLEEAVCRTLQEVRGAYALAIISVREPEKIVIARKESPLVVGIGKGENFVASDVPAFLSHTREVVLLNDGEVGVLTEKGLKLMTIEGTPVERKSIIVLWDAMMAEKAGHKHFMLKEIYEQPSSISSTLKGRFHGSRIVLPEAELTREVIEGIRKITIVACGTAYHAGLIGKYVIEEMTGIPVEVDVASEYRYRNPIVLEGTLFVAISQSGETADTLAAVKEARVKGAHPIAVTNVVGSSITREVRGVIYTRAGLEIGVAATKTFTAQVLTMYLLGFYLAQEKGLIDEKERTRLIGELEAIPSLMEVLLKQSHKVKLVARRFQKCRDFLFLGRNVNFPVALEGALKLKEISYIHAEGYAAGEMKHGPIALVDRMCPVVVVMTRNQVYEKIIGNVKEVAARDAFVIGIATEGDDKTAEYLDHMLTVPETDPLISPLLSIIPLQLLSYHIADVKGCDVDQPRNLAKSVTVE